MAIHSLEKIQTIPASLEKVWDFISSPKNLREITPDYMGFEITSTQLSDKMYAGQIITYKVRPLLGIPLNWCTEITHVKEHEYFVDEQRQGPYQLWHHQHHIREVKGGVEMTDIVHYQVPLGFIGELFVPLIVTPKLKDIFQYRFEKMEQLFGEI
jgi:ligand-binding SRPBCC domain-containing protein